MKFCGRTHFQIGNLAMGIAIFLITICIVGCSSKDDIAGGTSTDAGVAQIVDRTIAGVSQKGPFVVGSTVILMETEGLSLDTTGRKFIAQTRNSDGEFQFEHVNLKSSFAILSVEGYYRSELNIWNENRCNVHLNSVTNLKSRSQVNINILSHLTFDRIVKLVQSGIPFDEAKNQAENEIVHAFGLERNFDSLEDLNIFNASEGDALLLAVSSILETYKAAIYMGGDWEETCEKQQLYFDDLARDFADDGNLSQEALDQLWLLAVSILENNGDDLYREGNVEFVKEGYGKYVYTFAVKAKGLEDCNSELEGTSLEFEEIYGGTAVGEGWYRIFACKDGFWRTELGRRETVQD